MYNIKPFYANDDISQRKQAYYDQILYAQKRKSSNSPHRTIKIHPIQQPKISLSSNQRSSFNTNFIAESNLTIKDQPQLISYPLSQIPLKQSQKSQPKNPSFSQVNKTLLTKDPQRFKVLQQRAQLFKKLQLVTLGLPLEQNTCQSQLLSNKFILPHYKSDKITQIRQQQKKIKMLTAEMLQNEKIILRIKKVQESLIDRVQRIKQIDEQIYSNLDEDRTQQIEEYLRIAKNLLAEGQSEQKIISVLKKILY